jgi:transposase
LALADTANKVSWHSFPSIARLSEVTGLDRKTIIESLQRLKERGLILETGERKGRTRQVKVYRLCFERIPELERFRFRNGSENSPKDPRNWDTKPITEPKYNSGQQIDAVQIRRSIVRGGDSEIAAARVDAQRPRTTWSAAEPIGAIVRRITGPLEPEL